MSTLRAAPERVPFDRQGLIRLPIRCVEFSLPEVMETQLRSSFLPTSVAPVVPSNAQFILCSNFGDSWHHGSGGLRCGKLYCTPKASCDSPGKQNERAVWLSCVPTRRQILKLAHIVAGAAFLMPKFALAEEEKVKMYTNIDDARAAGEKLRDIKEAADGPVLVSSSGIKYRELERGVGNPIGPGDLVSVYYTISRLNGYYLDSMGYGKEGKNDVGETLNFQYGSGLVPEAVEGGMEGMQVGAKRRILVTPERGWVRPDLLPRPTSFFAERRLSDRRTTQALLIEVELVKAKPTNE